MNTLNALRLAVVVSSFSAGFCLAQAACPPGLTYVGQAYREASTVNKEAKVAAEEVTVVFVNNFPIDRNYRQKGGKWSGGSASAVMTDGDVPNGLHIVASGTEGGAKGWAIHKPEMVVLAEDDEGRIVQRAYKVRLYCHTGSGALDMAGHVSCNVKADFCAKPKQR